MNKGIWHYQIDKLFTMYEVSFPDMHIDTVIAADHVIWEIQPMSIE